MKRFAVISSAIGYLLSISSAFAQNTIQLNRPTVNNNPAGFANINNFIANILTLAFIIAVIVVLAMLVWGAIEWILSGGEKEAVGKARGKIINALIGLAILAVAFAITQLAANFLGFNLTNLTIPTPAPS